MLEGVTAEDREKEMAKLLRVALELLWVQEQAIGGIFNGLAALENLIRVEQPGLYSRYEQMRAELVHQAYEEQRSKVEYVERAVDSARRLAGEI